MYIPGKLHNFSLSCKAAHSKHNTVIYFSLSWHHVSICKYHCSVVLLATSINVVCDLPHSGIRVLRVIKTQEESSFRHVYIKSPFPSQFNLEF